METAEKCTAEIVTERGTSLVSVGPQPNTLLKPLIQEQVKHAINAVKRGILIEIVQHKGMKEKREDFE